MSPKIYSFLVFYSVSATQYSRFCFFSKERGILFLFLKERVKKENTLPFSLEKEGFSSYRPPLTRARVPVPGFPPRRFCRHFMPPCLPYGCRPRVVSSQPPAVLCAIMYASLTWDMRARPTQFPATPSGPGLLHAFILLFCPPPGPTFPSCPQSPDPQSRKKKKTAMSGGLFLAWLSALPLALFFCFSAPGNARVRVHGLCPCIGTVYQYRYMPLRFPDSPFPLQPPLSSLVGRSSGHGNVFPFSCPAPMASITPVFTGHFILNYKLFLFYFE